jgi:hypothetical protein
VSRYFWHGDQLLWNPSNQVGVLFIRTAETLAAVEELPTGIGPMRAASTRSTCRRTESSSTPGPAAVERGTRRGDAALRRYGATAPLVFTGSVGS